MDALEQLRAAYVPRLRAQLDELRERLADGDVETATRLAHRIAGAAGSYGLGPVSQLARALEVALEAGEAPARRTADVEAMRAAIGEVAAVVARAPVILVYGAPAGEADGVLVVDDPIAALEIAMDRPLAAVVVPYTSGALGGRALLRSLGGLEGARAVPCFVTEAPSGETSAVAHKVGARAAFEGPFDEAILARVREALA